MSRGVTIFMALAAMCSATETGERIVFAEIASKALDRPMPVTVVRPESPRPGAPVLFILHGRGRHHRSVIESDAMRHALLASSCYVVLPQGEDGWYINSPARAADRHESYLEEVIHWADATFPVSRRAEARGIAGWSMGGYGAVRFAQTHAGQFGFVASIIGLLDFPRPETLPEGQNYRVPIDRFTSDAATWRKFNPTAGVDSLRGCALTLVLASRGFERTMNENFLAALAQRAIPARVHRLEGGHEFSLVERALPLVLADAAEFFAKSRPVP